MKTPIKGLRDGSLGGFVWSCGGSGAQALLRVAVLSVFARLLAPADFGLLGAALVVVGLSEVFCFIGIAPALVQRSDLEPRHVSTAWTLSLLFGVTTSVVVYMAAPLVASFFRMSQLVAVVHWISPVFAIHAIGLVGRALLQRNLQFKTLAICEFVSFIVYAAVGLVLALLGFGVTALVAAYLTSAAVMAVAMLLVRRHPKTLRVEKEAARDLLGFGAGISLTSVLNYLARQGDNIVVGRWLGSSALGAYGRAYALMAAPVTAAGQVMGNVLFASVSRVQQDRARMGRAFLSVTTVVAMLTVPISVLSLIAAPEIVRVLLGPGWTDVIAPLQVLVLGMFFRVAYKIGGAVGKGVGAVYRMAVLQAVYATVIVGGGLIGQHWGLKGVALAVLAGVVLNYVLVTRLSLGLLDMKWRDLAPILSAALLLSILGGFPAWVVAEIVRSTGLPEVMGLILIGVSWAVVVRIALRLRLTWFLDRYTYRILQDLCGRISGGSRLLAVVLPAGDLKVLEEKEQSVTPSVPSNRGSE